MKNAIFVPAVVLLAAQAVLGFSTTLAEEPSMDPLVVAPDDFELAYENEFVRAVRVTVVDGKSSAKHAHTHRLVVFLNDCIWLDTAEDGSVVEEAFNAGDVSWQEAIVHDGSPNHVRDTCRLLEVELK